MSLIKFLIVNIAVLAFFLVVHYFLVNTLQIISLIASIFFFNYSLFFLYNYNCYNFTFQFTENLLSHNEILIFNFNFGLDGLSLFFFLLTTFLLPLVLIFSSNLIKDILNFKFYLNIIFFLNFCLLMFFATNNILIFYFFFEIVLLPIFILIIFLGTRSRKILASFYFFIYTFFGSIFFIISIIALYSEVQSFDFLILLNYAYNINFQLYTWPLIAIAMLIKIPMFPFHLWLPEAHVEAPTVGSVYLASILLKLGGYGFLRFLFIIFPVATVFFTPFIQLLCVLSIFYSSALILRQVDIKKIIAYSSIIHMNIAVFSIFTYCINGLQGSILLMLAHGLSSGALFFLVGILYERHKSRLLIYYSGLFLLMPLFTFFFIFFCFCNTGFPGTINFIGELLTFISIIYYSVLSKTYYTTFLILFGFFSSTCFSIWLINKLVFGNIKTYQVITSPFNLHFYDLTKIEFLVLVPFTIYAIAFGLHPFILKYSLQYSELSLLIFNLI